MDIELMVERDTPDSATAWRASRGAFLATIRVSGLVAAWVLKELPGTCLTAGVRPASVVDMPNTVKVSLPETNELSTSADGLVGLQISGDQLATLLVSNAFSLLTDKYGS